MGKELRNDLLSKYDIDDYKTDKLNLFVKKINFDKKVKVYVIKSREFNAFATPGKYIFIYTGLLDKLHSYEQLASLLAHEYTHIDKNHGLRSVGRSFGYEIFTTVFLSNDLKKELFDNSNMLINLEYSRAFEKEADLNTLNLLQKEKIASNGMLSLLKLMRKVAPERILNSELSDHPNTIERIEYIEDAIEEMNYNAVPNIELETIFNAIKQGV
ncbi:MAG: M48 family metallopeptidase [Flavobacteriaceae bacterium]|nr:M48 family metallopeptidase [Flavobacteriaceae bacterium]